MSVFECPFCGSKMGFGGKHFSCSNLGNEGKEACGALIYFPHCSTFNHLIRQYNKRSPINQLQSKFWEDKIET